MTSVLPPSASDPEDEALTQKPARVVEPGPGSREYATDDHYTTTERRSPFPVVVAAIVAAIVILVTVTAVLLSSQGIALW